MGKKIFIIDTEKVEKHFSKGQILGYAKELEVSQIAALAYLYFFNNVSISLNDVKKDSGRGMYREFAQCLNKMLLEFGERPTKNIEEIIAELEKTQAQYNAVVNQNRELQEELRPFRHEYFKVLDTKTIAELAKKSIKITTLNIELESQLDDADRQLQECIKSKCSDCESDIILVNKKICKSLTKSLDENNRYRKALEEIEKELKEDVYCESQECGCDDFEECLNCVKTQILDIINKAKKEG